MFCTGWNIYNTINIHVHAYHNYYILLDFRGPQNTYYHNIMRNPFVIYELYGTMRMRIFGLRK